MPLYEYECTVCGERTEIIQRLSDPPLGECPRCGKPVKKLLSAPAFQFKGSGWYVTDYAGKSAGSSSGKSEEGESKSSAKSESAKSASDTSSTASKKES